MADEDLNQENQELVDNKEDENKEVDNNETPEESDSPDEEKQIAGQHMRRVNLALPLVVVILAIIGYGLYYNKIDFGRIQKIKTNDLKGVSPKIKYVLRHSTPGTLWLFFCLVYVIYKRAGTPALVPTSGHEHLTEVANKILQNTVEHFVLHMASQLILITFITAKQTLNLIPTLNLLFITGRFLFFVGYPKFRPFGFFLYFAPLLSVMAYIGFRYVRLFF